MEAGIFLCHWYFLLKVYLQRRRARQNPVQDEEAPVPKEETPAENCSEGTSQDVPLNHIVNSTSNESGVVYSGREGIPAYCSHVTSSV
jgi:hypothetical protein